MPRDGSPQLPEGMVPAEPMSIGEVADPPFAVLPKPKQLFARRADRLSTLAAGHQLESYLRFLAEICRAQHEVQASLPPAPLPPPERLAQAAANGLPPLALGVLASDDVAERTFSTLLEALAARELTETSRAVVESVAAASPDDRNVMMVAVLLDQVSEDEIAVHVLAAAAVQVHLSRLAAQLDVGSLKRIADGACPACGGGPVASAIVNWEGAVGTRFCTCAMCATQWNVPRIRCLVCGNEKGVAYHALEGGDGKVSGETCDACKGYVKILHQHKDADLDPVADDVASLALDLTLGREGWRRAAVDPFLMGY